MSIIVVLLFGYFLLWVSVKKWQVYHRQYQVLVQQWHTQQVKYRDDKKQQAYLRTLPKVVVQRLLEKKPFSISARLRHVIDATKRCQCQLKTLMLKPDLRGSTKQQQLQLKLQGHYGNLMCFVKKIGQSPLYCWFNDLNLKTKDTTGGLTLTTLLEL